MDTDNQTDRHLDALDAALDDLPPACKRAFILVRFDDRSFADAATRMGISEEQVKLYVNRAFSYVMSRMWRPPAGYRLVPVDQSSGSVVPLAPKT
jgi:DNA-directed RNA polymerase specialized sigma24 family protein